MSPELPPESFEPTSDENLTRRARFVEGIWIFLEKTLDYNPIKQVANLRRNPDDISGNGDTTLL